MATADTSAEKLCKLLRKERIDAFNESRAGIPRVDLSGFDLSGLDLRGLDARGLDLRGCHFRQADLRGIDFSEALLEGAAIDGAKISGTCFPKALPAEEINLSLLHGTCMRYR